MPLFSKPACQVTPEIRVARSNGHLPMDNVVVGPEQSCEPCIVHGSGDIVTCFAILRHPMQRPR